MPFTLSNRTNSLTWGRSLALLACAAVVIVAGCGKEPATVTSPDLPGVNLAPLPKAARVEVAQAGSTPDVLAVIPAAGAVKLVAFGSDGKRVVVAEESGLAFWDLDAKKLAKAVEELPAPVSAAAAGRDGKLVAVAGMRFAPAFAGVVKFWDIASGEALPKSVEHGRAVNGLMFNGDGSIAVLATAAADADPKKAGAEPPGATLIHDMAAGKTKSTLGGHGQAVSAAAISPDGSKVASVSMHRGPNFTSIGELVIWDAVSGKELAKPAGTIGNVRAVAFSNDGSLLAVAYDDAQGKPLVDLLETANGKVKLSTPAAKERANSIAFSGDGKKLAVGRADGSVTVYDAATAKVVSEAVRHLGVVSSVAFSPDGQKLISGGADRKVVVATVEAKP